MLKIEGDSSESQLSVISYIKTRKYIKRGCQLFMEYVTRKKLAEKRLEDVPIVRDFLKVFPEDLLGIPLMYKGLKMKQKRPELAGLSGGKQAHMAVRGLENVGVRGTRYGANRRITRVQNTLEPMISPRFLEEGQVTVGDWLSHLPGSFIKRVG
ncbi:hypothetical protein Tco_1309265 [Tanacetum coccineum]